MIIKTRGFGSSLREGMDREKKVMSLVLQGPVFTTYHVSLERVNVTVRANGNTADMIQF